MRPCGDRYLRVRLAHLRLQNSHRTQNQRPRRVVRRHGTLDSAASLPSCNPVESMPPTLNTSESINTNAGVPAGAA